MFVMNGKYKMAHHLVMPSKSLPCRFFLASFSLKLPSSATVRYTVTSQSSIRRPSIREKCSVLCVTKVQSLARATEATRMSKSSIRLPCRLRSALTLPNRRADSTVSENMVRCLQNVMHKVHPIVPQLIWRRAIFHRLIETLPSRLYQLRLKG